MRDAIHPGAQRTLGVESLKAPPQRQMDFLQKIAALIGVHFIATRETAKGRAEFIRGPLI